MAGLSKRAQDRVVRATVTFTKKGGQGVLVGGSLILTAAHCVAYELEGSMVLGDYFIEEILTSRGDKLKVAPMAVEPVTDIAVLGALDGQAFYDECDAFEKFCSETDPIALCRKEPEPFKEFPVYIWAHEGLWITGTAGRYGAEAAVLHVKADAKINGGTSGSPIVNRFGKLVGVVSNSGEDNGIPGRNWYDGSNPFPAMALPVWLLRRISIKT